MVMVKFNDQEFSMDGYLTQNLTTAKEVIRKDWDMCFVVDGMEGTGKSVLTMQAAYYCDPTFNINRVVFTPSQFKNAVIESQPYQAIVYDEAYTGLSARGAMTLINRTLISMLAEIRQKNLFIFIVMPCFFDLDKYVALWRSRGLIHVYTKGKFERGNFAFYNIDMKKSLYVNGKKYYSYKLPRPNFIGRFTNFYVVDPDEYKQKKLDALMDRKKKQESEENQKELRSMIFNKLVSDKMLYNKIPNVLKARIIGISEVHYYRMLKEFESNKEVDEPESA